MLFREIKVWNFFPCLNLRRYFFDYIPNWLENDRARENNDATPKEDYFSISFAPRPQTCKRKEVGERDKPCYSFF